MNNFIQNCTGVILAGGENKRMPVLKAFIEVEGKKTVERNLRIMKRLFGETFIITNQPELYSYLGVPLFGDVYDVRGPMTGIFTALLNSSNQWVFVSACDMPFINPALIRFMADERYNPACLSMMSDEERGNFDPAQEADIYDVVVPVVNHRAEPLFAFYSKKALSSLEQFILSGKKGIKDFLLNRSKRVKYITTEEIKGIDPEAKSFINLNTPEDVELYLHPQDRLKFKKSVIRRKKCSDLELQS
ncbi:MAG: molybdenum cofactor guanylyltransferase [Nitrospirae bacterium]|nr:molybdenum cofactor guanylyltransferase [Nitrospirota bacterium]